MIPRPFPAHIHCAAPVFNEECAVARFVTETARYLETLGRPWEIVLLDDGSTDGTRAEAGKLARTLPVRVVPLPHRGIGAVLQEFVALARGWPAGDAVIFTEGDGTCDPSFIGPALELMNSTGADVCAASRYLPGAEVTGFPARRRLQSYLSNRMLAAKYGGVSDYTLFARVYRAETFRRVAPADLRRDGFEANAELLIALLAAGAKAAEVPVRYRYELKAGRSKLPTLRTIAGYGRLFRER